MSELINSAVPVRDIQQQLIEAFELYEQALNSGCRCYSDPGGTCPHCGLIERARRKAKAIVGDYTQY